MIKYKIDVFEELKKRGYNQTRIQKERLLPAQTAQNIKAGKSITLETLNKICIMCKLQPGGYCGSDSNRRGNYKILLKNSLTIL